jgi:PKD domain
MRRTLILVILVALLALAMLGAGCGGNGGEEKGGHIRDPEPGNHSFHLYASPNFYTGPVPLKVKFTATPFRARGNIAYIWRFDDGTSTREQNPTHTFSKAGYYQVLMIGEDEKGHSDAWNVILSTWTPKEWARIQRGIGPREQAALVNEENRRTAKRRKKYPFGVPHPPSSNPAPSAK